MKEVYLTEMQQKALDFTNSINQTVVSEEDKERYDEFSKWVQAINYLSEDFYVPDEKGNLPVLDEISINAFKDTYKKALEECDKVIKMNSNEGISGKMKDLAKQIKETLMKDSVAFEDIDPEINKNMTLDEVIGLGRSITVDIGDAPIVSESGSFSSRIPIKVADMPGGAVDGYFTPSSDVDTTKNTQNLTLELKEKYPGLGNLIDAITTASHYKLIQTGLTDLSVGRAVRYRVQELDDNVFKQNDPDKMKKFAIDYYANTLDKVISEDVVKKAKKDPDFIRCMDEICMKYGKIVKNHAVYVADNQTWLGVPEGSNIDKRNVAMSTMSEMLGKKGLIATAKPMVVVMNGKPVTGTFMTRAFEYNAYDNKKDNPIKDLGPEAYDNPAVFDDIAALQALDYICGNLDRHPGNIMLKFEEVNGEKKLVGITGIDNDMSWGVNNPAKGNQDTIGNIFVRPEQMCAIGKKTADYIMGLTFENMKLSLRGYKLDDGALEFAWKRTQRLQEAIKEGKKHYEDKKVPVGKIDSGFLRVVDEADWKNYHISDLAKDNNQFHEILYSKANWLEQRPLNKKASQFDNCDRVARQTLLGIEPLPEVKPIEGKAVGTGVKYTIDKKARMGVNDPDAIKIVVPDNKKINIVGGYNSKRYMVSYTNSKGEPQDGFFTPSATNDYKSAFKNVTDNYLNELKKENNPQWNEVFERTLDYILQNEGELEKNRSKKYDFVRLGYDKETAEALKADKKFIDKYVKYLDDLSLVKTKLNLAYTKFGVPEGGTIDKRNVAMSKVGDQLGVANVIAQSRNAEVLIDGKLVEGVFMDKARGISYTKIKSGDPAANLKSSL